MMVGQVNGMNLSGPRGLSMSVHGSRLNGKFLYDTSYSIVVEEFCEDLLGNTFSSFEGGMQNDFCIPTL